MIRFVAIAVIAAAGLLCAAVPVQAAVKWTFTGSNCTSNSACAYDGADFVGDDSSTNVTVTAWSTTEPGLGNNMPNEAYLRQFGSGLGINHEYDPSTAPNDDNHEVDNSQRFDIMMFDFGAEQVNLEEISIGWFTNDSDVSVLAYTGTEAFSNETHLQQLIYGHVDDAANAGTQNFTTNGWDLIGNYDLDDHAGNQCSSGCSSLESDSISTSVYSSYWLIGAYNQQFGGCTDGGNCTVGNDEVKILSLVASLDPGNPSGGPAAGVAEPSSLLLLALGMMAPVAMRRRREKR